MVITGGILLTPFKEIRNPTIFIENGKIIEIETKGEIFSDNVVINAKGKYIVPGFIDPHTHIGVYRLESEPENHGFETGDPLTPHLNVSDGLDIYDPAFEDALKGGVTTIGVLPGSYMSFGGNVERINIIPGQGAIYKTNRKEIKRYAFLKIAVGEHPKRFLSEQKMVPTTRMGIMAELRNIFIKAKDYITGKNKKYDPKLEALVPVIEKKIPLRVHIHTARDIITFLNFAEEFDLKVIFDHATEAYLIKEKLLDVPIVYGPIVFSRRGTELKNLDSSNLKYMKNLLFSITTDHPTIPIQYLDLLAGLAISEGFSEKEALSLITINPAKILGMEDQIGSIEPGKDADILILSGRPFDPETRVLYTIINGEIAYRREES